MKIKKISIIILSIVAIGGFIGGTAYKTYVESSRQQELEIKHIKENTHKTQQTRVQQVDKEKNESTDENKPSFESKVSSYLTEFKESKEDIDTLNHNLDSIKTNTLNETEKLQLANLKLAAKDWSILTVNYDYVRQVGNQDHNPDKALKYAKETLDTINTENLIATGIMSKESVDKKVSCLSGYIEKKETSQINQNTQQNATKNEKIIVTGPNTVPGVYEYDLDDVNLTPKIEPSIITERSSCYKVKTENNIYIDFILNVHNLNEKTKMAKDTITAKIKTNSNDYKCFSIAESANGHNLEKDNSIKPLETRKIHYVAEIPKTEATGEIILTLTINGKDFSNKFDLEGMMLEEVKTNNKKETAQINKIKKKTTQERAEYYYKKIKDAKKKQSEYINSFNKPEVKQSLQTSQSAAFAEATLLEMKYPEDTNIIEESLKKVLDGK